MLKADPKPISRIRDAQLLRTLHFVWVECCLCGEVSPLSLHHISKHPRDDVRGNLCMVCGSGTTGCHGRLEARDLVVMRFLGDHIRSSRPDVIQYLIWRKGELAASEWMFEHLLIGS